MSLFRCGGGDNGEFTTGTFTTTQSGESVTINCGFRPTTIVVIHRGNNSAVGTFPDASTLTIYSPPLTGDTKQFSMMRSSGGGQTISVYDMPVTNNYATITGISDTGFSFKAVVSGSALFRGTYEYFVK